MPKNIKKTFILDTSVVIHDPYAIFKFDENNIVVPFALLSEIDSFKSGNDQRGFHAREFSRILNQLKEERDTLLELVPLPEPYKGSLCLSSAGNFIKKIPIEFHNGNKDQQIIATALKWHEELPKENIILVSKDINVRLMGHSCGLKTEDYKQSLIKNLDEVNYQPVVYTVEDNLIDTLMTHKTMPVSDFPFVREVNVNQCLTLKGHGDHPKSALAIVEQQQGNLVLKKLIRDQHKVWGISPRNREQIFAMALLKNQSIRLVSLIGKAGTGKTLLALAAGLDQTCDQKLYQRVVVLRPMVSVGKEIGWLPGDVHSKIDPWLKPIYDNISLFLGDEPENEKKDIKQNGVPKYQYLFDSGIIEVEVMSFIRGRSINNAFIIVDESQNLTHHEIKTLVTRAAGNSKVVLTGDLGQIDIPYLDSHSSGLTHVVKKFSGQPIGGHVNLVKGERSELAEIAADLL